MPSWKNDDVAMSSMTPLGLLCNLPHTWQQGGGRDAGLVLQWVPCDGGLGQIGPHMVKIGKTISTADYIDTWQIKSAEMLKIRH